MNRSGALRVPFQHRLEGDPRCSSVGLLLIVQKGAQGRGQNCGQVLHCKQKHRLDLASIAKL